MKTWLKRILKGVAFLAVLQVAVSYASAVLFPRWKGDDNTPARLATFYRQPRNSIDVLYLGGSAYRNGISPLTIWEEYGIASYSRASSVQAPVVSYAYLVETLKTHTPALVVLDVRAIFKEYDVDLCETKLRQSLDPMKWSAIKIAAIRDVVRQSRVQTFASYLFPILRYHDRWKELKREDFFPWRLDLHDGQKGAVVHYEIRPQVLPNRFMAPTTKELGHSNGSRAYFEKIVALCRERDIDLLLVTLPRLQWRYSHYLGIRRFAEEHGLPYIDYNLPENMAATSIDPAIDFVNPGHLNVYGAVKIARHLGAYLHASYNLPDRRQDPGYARWNDDLAAFRKRYEQMVEKNKNKALLGM